MQLAYKVYTLHIPREIPSLPCTLDASFLLRIRLLYNIPYCSIIRLPIYILTLYVLIVF